MTPRWPHGDPDDVARALLAGPRFGVIRRGPASTSWWDLAWQALRDVLARALDPLVRLGANGAITNIVGVAVLIAVLAFLAYVVVRCARRFRRARRRRPAEHGRPLPLHEEAGARTLRARALAAAADGRYHDAAAYLWLSALRALDESGHVRYDAARTPREWRSLVGDPAFDAFARDAVLALFAGRTVDRRLVERMTSNYDRVVPG